MKKQPRNTSPDLPEPKPLSQVDFLKPAGPDNPITFEADRPWLEQIEEAAMDGNQSAKQLLAQLYADKGTWELEGLGSLVRDPSQPLAPEVAVPLNPQAALPDLRAKEKLLAKKLARERNTDAEYRASKARMEEWKRKAKADKKAVKMQADTLDVDVGVLSGKKGEEPAPAQTTAPDQTAAQTIPEFTGEQAEDTLDRLTKIAGEIDLGPDPSAAPQTQETEPAPAPEPTEMDPFLAQILNSKKPTRA